VRRDNIVSKKKLLFFVILSVVGLAGLLYLLQQGRSFEVDRTSPNGDYRVKLTLREEKGNGSRDYTEIFNAQFFKGQEIVLAYDAENSDRFEPSIRQGLQIIEWVDDNVLTMREFQSNQPFDDIFIITNNTDDNIKYLNISYGNFDSYIIFDMAPKTQLKVRASPAFRRDGSSNDSLGFGGKTQNGKKFEGDLSKLQRKSPADDPYTYEITVNSHDLKN
jgi:hypothetical protein